MNPLVLIVQIAGRRCAISAADVKSVIDLGTIAPVPRAPAFIAGLTTLRSQALTVIDCRLALGLGGEVWPTDARAAVIAVEGHSYALMVDAIEDIASALSEPGQIPGGFGAHWESVAHGMIETGIGPALLLDLVPLIAGPDGAQGRNVRAA
ncbi:MAG: chemotaxis protein CheW [Erythrobacter sp.]